MKYVITIPSKGRAGKAQLLNDLYNMQYHNVMVFTEPQDTPVYQVAYPNFKFYTLPESNKGIGYSRSHILAYIRSLPDDIDWVWMIDDDITGFHTVLPSPDINFRRCVNTGHKLILAKTVELAEVYQNQYPNTMLYSMHFRNFGWRVDHFASFNRKNGVALLWNVANVKKTNIWYDPELALKEDRDISFRILSEGYITCTFNYICFNSPQYTARSGGCTDFYTRELSVKCCQLIKDRWGDAVTLHEKKGLVEFRTNWSKFDKMFGIEKPVPITLGEDIYNVMVRNSTIPSTWKQ